MRRVEAMCYSESVGEEVLESFQINEKGCSMAKLLMTLE
jgi:hypothetical protein